jgi:hypothetical protein
VKGNALRRTGVLAGILAGPFFLVSVGLNTWASLDYLHQLGWEFVGGAQIELTWTLLASSTISIVQLKASSGSGPELGSIPSPLKEITSPGTTPVSRFGDIMIAVGALSAVRDASFATLTVMGAESFELPVASRARAVRVCAPFDMVRESHATTYGAAVTSSLSTPSTRN